MRALVIDEDTKSQIKDIISFAEKHRRDLSTLKKTMEGLVPPVGDILGHSMKIYRGYRAVYSIEEQPCGWCRHLSVSVDAEGKLPSIPAVEVLMGEFGFSGTINDCLNVWVEENMAVNILQQVQE
jgi:hypothetical protein